MNKTPLFWERKIYMKQDVGLAITWGIFWILMLIEGLIPLKFSST
jgi:hypothetical protein